MRKVIALVAIISLCFVGMAIAEDSEGITIKQEVFYTWNDLAAKNATTVTIIKGKPVDSFPKWANMLIDGTVIDAGAAYEDDTIRDAVILIGREFGSLGKYVPWLVFPFKDRIDLSIHYAGIYLPNVAEELNPEGCSGLGYIKGSLKW